MYPNICRLNVDSVNNQTQAVELKLDVNTSIMVSNASMYSVAVEKAEVPITLMPINVISDPFIIAIDYPATNPPHPVLQPKLNFFSIQGEYFSVVEMINKVNKIIHDDLYPTVSCGVFGFNSKEKEIDFKYKKNDNLGCEVWFDSRLVYLLGGISGLFSKEIDPLMSSNTETFHKVTYDLYTGSDTNPVIKTQEDYRYPRFFGFKSVRLFTSLPIRKYLVFNQSNNSTEPSNILQEIIMDTSDYIEGQPYQLYIPQNLIYTELTGISEIREFTLEVRIHYKNGRDYVLKYGQGEYTSFTLCFIKNKIEA